MRNRLVIVIVFQLIAVAITFTVFGALENRKVAGAIAGATMLISSLTHLVFFSRKFTLISTWVSYPFLLLACLFLGLRFSKITVGFSELTGLHSFHTVMEFLYAGLIVTTLLDYYSQKK